jgi:hypothetical protein
LDLVLGLLWECIVSRVPRLLYNSVSWFVLWVVLWILILECDLGFGLGIELGFGSLEVWTCLSRSAFFGALGFWVGGLMDGKGEKFLAFRAVLELRV